MSPLSPAFCTQPDLFLQRFNFVHPLFSWSYELLFPQPLYFDNDLRCPRGVGVSAPATFNAPTLKPANSFVHRLLQALCRRQKTQVAWNQANPNSLGKAPGWGMQLRLTPLYDALLGEQDSSTRGLARDHVLAREARAQADNTRDRSVQGRFALDQDRLAIPGNLEDVKSGFHHFQTAWNQTIAQGDSLDGRHTALRRVAVRALEKGRQVPVFG